MKISCDWYKTPKGLYIIKNKYDIFNAFRRLRSILSNDTYPSLRYIYQTPITESLLELREKITPFPSHSSPPTNWKPLSSRSRCFRKSQS